MAQDLLTSRLGDVQRGVPITPSVGKLTFAQAAANVEQRYLTTGKRSIKVVARRIKKHLLPYFGDRRMAGITAADAVAYTAKHRRMSS